MNHGTQIDKYFYCIFISLQILPCLPCSTNVVRTSRASNGSDVILTAQVTQQTANWNENKTRIYTKAIIQVNEYLKGINTGGTVTVKYLGGEVGDIGEMYSHMPRFEDKEEVLVSLKKDDKDTEYKVYNGENGKISIVNDPKTGEKLTTSNLRISSLKSQIKSYIND